MEIYFAIAYALSFIIALGFTIKAGIEVDADPMLCLMIALLWPLALLFALGWKLSESLRH